jgi:hypothetical protein
MNRIFRSTDATLETVRAALDAAWGYPNPETKTNTSLLPASECPHDAQGRVYVIVSANYCEYQAVAEMLPTLIASGQVEELTNAQYEQAFPRPPRPSRKTS